MKLFFLIFASIVVSFSCTNQHSAEEETNLSLLLSDSSKIASCVFLASDEKNNPVISWCEKDSTGRKYAYMAYFDSATNQFDIAIPIPIAQNTSIHEEGMPKIAVKNDGTVVAIYETSNPYPGKEWGLGDIRYIQSFDHGKTWTPPKSISPDVEKGMSASFSGLARLGDGEVGAVWLGDNADESIIGRPILFSKTNGKNGFGEEVLITRHGCECCRTAVSSDSKGNIAVAYRGVTDNNIRDIMLNTSTDKGSSFSVPVSINNDNWVIDGCPHNGPCVVNTNTAIYATWFTGAKGKGVYYAGLNKETKHKEVKLISANGQHIQFAVMPDGSRVIAYNEIIHAPSDSVYSKIVLNKIEGEKILSKTISDEKSKAYYPVIVGFGKSNIIVAWSEGEKIYYRMMDVTDINNEKNSSSDVKAKSMAVHKN